ncbi:MAG: hypothetical protein K0S76_1457 [Herbinix sp.]|nr:hypothetical protein [Herbinix sp.]
MNLISKKDLLAITGISYGQLYRWKRERLIPEEWFIKQSSYTGQETFFPREQILSRIKSILELKDLYSLEELAKILSPENTVAKISIHDLHEIDEINPELLNMIPKAYGKDQYDIYEVAFTIAMSGVVKKAGLTDDRCEELLQKSISAAVKQRSSNVSCTVFVTDGEYHTVFSSNSAILFDDDIEVIAQISISEIVDKIKIKYKNRFV